MVGWRAPKRPPSLPSEVELVLFGAGQDGRRVGRQQTAVRLGNDAAGVYRLLLGHLLELLDDRVDVVTEVDGGDSEPVLALGDGHPDGVVILCLDTERLAVEEDRHVLAGRMADEADPTGTLPAIELDDAAVVFLGLGRRRRVLGHLEELGFEFCATLASPLGLGDVDLDFGAPDDALVLADEPRVSEDAAELGVDVGALFVDEGDGAGDVLDDSAGHWNVPP